MNQLAWLALVSVGLSLILTPVFREIFRTFGVVDEPDHDRKIHQRAIPRGGGIALAVSYMVSLLVVRWFFGTGDEQFVLVAKVLPAACTIFAVGIIDDLWGLKPWQKLAGQVMAAGIACSSGILSVDGTGFHGGAWWTVPAAILWLLFCTNGFNLIDGMDGLAAGAGMLATLAILAAALLEKNTALAVATIPLAGCLLGFLRYNFSPATIFLGDSGSLLIGFLLGCYGIVWTEKSATLPGMAAPIMALSLPLVDVGLSVVRRFLSRQPIFMADRGHIHHRLLDRGMSPKQAAMLLYGVCGAAAVFSFVEVAVHSNARSGAIILVFCATAGIGLRYLGETGLSLAGRLLFAGGVQPDRPATRRLTALQKSIEDVKTAAVGIGLPAAGTGSFTVTTTGQFGLSPTHMLITDEVRWHAASRRPRSNRRRDWIERSAFPE